ncbi:uncharacterized protein LOC136094133 [Hydra vulgaris]|uniref:uncharacterized protein LOC136094133 n=1 Tax=Hydra vulgaris TaxID=6087 RepID=UPI0032E9F99C
MSLLEGHDRRRYNLPSHEEVAIVFVGDDGAPPASREIVIYLRGQPLRTILSMSANLDPLQYVVDAYVKVEGQRLAFIRNNQNKLRSEQYDALHEHVINRANDLNVRPGRVVILPSSYVGSPRALKENFEDAMAVIKKYGKPDLFITFTCNPKWREIVENLNPGQTANDRPDLVCRHGVLGKVVSHVQVIEFQKRGLPHVHILLHFVNADKLETAEDIDSLISAEIPDPAVDPELFEIIKSCMIHRPCGILNPNSPCIKGGKCTKKFPKEFNPHTVAIFNGYPRYRRVDNGRIVNIKGHDCANVVINEQVNHDEINTFLNCRYVSAPEALWRIFEYSLSDMSHNIIRLQVHLPDNQMI